MLTTHAHGRHSLRADTKAEALGSRSARDEILELFTRTRACTDALAARLSAEDQQLQSMDATSPTKWHRAHTTWFFETFVLVPEGREVFDRRYAFLFNSYYDTLGARHAKGRRGLVSRPRADEISEYRKTVDARVTELLLGADGATLARLLPVVTLGVAHEEQHQELLLTDILHAFHESPLRPAYRKDPTAAGSVHPRAPVYETLADLQFVSFAGGMHQVGAAEDGSFAFDNERPRHKEWVEPFALCDRLVVVRELKAFIEAGGYRTPSLWLSEGYDFVRAQGMTAPLYSTIEGGSLQVFTLGGTRTASDDDPVAHLSYYEADALARFLGGRLPTETEWEVAAEASAATGNFVESEAFRPLPAAGLVPTAGSSAGVRQLFGDAWEWTRSSYEPYPGYRVPEGALGEYNGKFMINQRVLRGGSCLTPSRHVRRTYRNFWHPGTQFQMTGLRLARELTV